MTPEPTANAVSDLAQQHGLALDPATIRFNEAGLDYRVAFATSAETGEDWVLRIPRRADVSAKIVEEKRILDFVGPRLPIAVPDWRISSPNLIAYPLLPGKPGLTLDVEGQPVWHYDVASPEYAQSLAEVIVSLHRLDTTEAAEAGIPFETPEQVRQRWSGDLDRVLDEFDVESDLVTVWRTWIDDDDLWPERTVLTHGELYPAHLLLDEDSRIVSALDWTTARVSDPALDFMYQFMIAPPEQFAATVDAYRDLTGHSEPNLAGRCSELIAAGPLNYALFALESGEPEHRAAAEAQLRPNG
ncbi:macrolide phosphotransferase [Arthrobacter pigmenti]|uniref:Macrolide phosphotransferase n=1 Tax=Arthrobacter pigmenti TaxID=271432 RepID=A0A846RKH2_9MICC|nr:macrolide 2'-phosphotransferase [Arthrobacter pigmenti]NJC23723.1 macrolide phosphotransferase [Arthrobacter pigmenti]